MTSTDGRASLNHQLHQHNLSYYGYYYHPPYVIGDVKISGGVVYIADSVPNGPNPQFNLTCATRGGPPTTVTWTRDSVIIAEGTKTVLKNPVTAQYTHTLTVTGRLGGLYTITVANNKPSYASASTFVSGELGGRQTIQIQYRCPFLRL